MNKEFTIEKFELVFRHKECSPIDVLAFATVIDFDDIEQTKKIYSFALENTEVKIADAWLPVKEKGRDLYYPDTIRSNYKLLNELIKQFMNEVLRPIFQNSEE